MRQLATIREIKDIKSIEDADKIECAIIDGWEVVIAKSDGFKVGSHVVYIEIDSIVPDRPEFEFLRNRKFRIRTIKLRGQVSQGLILPLSILPQEKAYKLGDDVTDALNIIKYDPEAERERRNVQRNKKPVHPAIKFMMRFKLFRSLLGKRNKGKTDFPDWIMKTDESRIQNLIHLFEEQRDKCTKFVVTEKLDGQSLTMYVKRLRHNRFEFGVCSRNLRLKTPDDSSWWTIAKQLNAEAVLKDIAKLKSASTVVLQGEIVGSGIQGNKYKINGYQFYAFNLIYDGCKQTQKEMLEQLDSRRINIVPVIEEKFELPKDIPALVEYAKGHSALHNTIREGVVIRNYDRGVSFKVINPDFLLAEKD